MVTGIGIDMVQVKRLERWLGDLKLLKRYFHPDELEYSLSLGKNASRALAARFAAKEAFAKALGTGLSNIKLTDIMIHNESNGKPELKLTGAAKQEMEKSGAKWARVSLTHEKEYAAAMVLLEGA